MNQQENVKFYVCKHCGQIMQLTRSTGTLVNCCGKPMEELTPNTSDGAHEKHVPVVTKVGNLVKVDVGTVFHPMLDEHSIEWVCLETDHGLHYRYMKPGEEPTAAFELKDEEPVAAYAYCNLHGFWKTKF